jgi:hypothetical protein
MNVAKTPIFMLALPISVAQLGAVRGGNAMVVLCKHLPPVLRAEDNEAGSRLLLQRLARRFE